MDKIKNILGKKGRTMELKKNYGEGSKKFELHKQLKASLGSGDLRNAVKVPDGEDINEWLAVNIIDFFNQINMLYGSLVEFCTTVTCPTMSAGPKYEYLWADGKNVKKPIRVSAPEYADYLMQWTQELLEDETLFPVNDTHAFPKSFRALVKTIFKRLFRIYAHVYYYHVKEIIELGVEAHLNTAFKHFYLFIREFDLVDSQEMAPLQHRIDLINSQIPMEDSKSAKKESAAAQAKVLDAEKGRSDAMSQLSRLESDFKRTKDQLTQEQQRASSLESEKLRLASESSDAQSRLRNAEEELRQKTEAITRVTSERDALSKKIKSLLD